MTEGSEVVIPVINEGIEIPNIDPGHVMTVQAVFGKLVAGNPELLKLINQHGPVLFAGVLFSFAEEWKIDENAPDGALPTKSVVEAEERAISWVRGVASAMGKFYEGELSLEPSDSEIEADTEIQPIN